MTTPSEGTTAAIQADELGETQEMKIDVMTPEVPETPVPSPKKKGRKRKSKNMNKMRDPNTNAWLNYYRAWYDAFGKSIAPPVTNATVACSVAYKKLPAEEKVLLKTMTRQAITDKFFTQN